MRARWRRFTPAKLDKARCLARTWACGRGGQCTRKPLKPGQPFCKLHGSGGQWRTHGRCDGPIPARKLLEFERRERQTKKCSRCRTSTLPSRGLRGGRRKVVQKQRCETKLQQCRDGTRLRTCTE